MGDTPNNSIGVQRFSVKIIIQKLMGNNFMLLRFFCYYSGKTTFAPAA
jgi:hypothetical protein